MYPRSGFRSGGTCKRTLVDSGFVPGKHANVPSFRFSFRGEHPPKPPFGKPLFCDSKTSTLTMVLFQSIAHLASVVLLMDVILLLLVLEPQSILLSASARKGNGGVSPRSANQANSAAAPVHVIKQDSHRSLYLQPQPSFMRVSVFRQVTAKRLWGQPELPQAENCSPAERLFLSQGRMTRSQKKEVFSRTPPLLLAMSQAVLPLHWGTLQIWIWIPMSF